MHLLRIQRSNEAESNQVFPDKYLESTQLTTPQQISLCTIEVQRLRVGAQKKRPASLSGNAGSVASGGDLEFEKQRVRSPKAVYIIRPCGWWSSACFQGNE